MKMMLFVILIARFQRSLCEPTRRVFVEHARLAGLPGLTSELP